MQLFTIGFTGKSAEVFFESLRLHHVRRVIDVRLNNGSQMCGFTKGKDLPYFLQQILGIAYEYLPEFAPTEDLMNDFRQKIISWNDYEQRYHAILLDRVSDMKMSASDFDGACLLCSEREAKECHRRLLAEYLARRFDGVEIVHI